MARKVLPATPARDRSRDDESLLLRSAETLGRMIGSLQRQLDVATGRLIGTETDDVGARKSGGAKRRGGSKAKSGIAARGGARRKSTSSTGRKTSRRRTTTSAKKR
jgi:hypothetical protein